MAGRKRHSYAGAALRRHDESEAERRLAQGLAQLGLSLEEAAALRHSDARKQGLARWIKRGTVIADEWLTSRLRMGHRVNISRAVGAYERPRSRAHRRLRDLLHVCYGLL